MDENLPGLVSLTGSEMQDVNGGGFWQDFWDLTYKDLQDFADGWHDAGNP